MEITAAVARAAGAPLSIERLHLEAPRADEVLVRLVAVGICRTDVEMRDRVFPVPQPLVLGHEGAGIVEWVGADVRTHRPGDHVILSYDRCGHCSECARGAPAYCAEFFPRNLGGARIDGTTPLSAPDGTAVPGHFFGQSAFATHVVAAARNAIVVADDAPLDILAPLGCLQTGAGAVGNAFRARPGHALAVFGVGANGLAAIMAAAAAGVSPIVAVDLVPDRLAIANTLGATVTVQAVAEDPVAAIHAATGGRGVDFVLDTTGDPRVLGAAFASLAPQGVLGTIGVPKNGGELTVPIVPLMTGGRTVRGIVQGEGDPERTIPALVEAFKAGRFPVDRLVRHYRFAEINRAMDDVDSCAAVKPVLLFDPPSGPPGADGISAG